MSTWAASRRPARASRGDDGSDANDGQAHSRAIDVEADGAVSAAVESADGELALLTGWGRTSPTLAHLHHPEDSDRVADLLSTATDRGAIARGLGRAYGDAAQNAGGRVLELTRLRRLRRFDADTGIVTAAAGMSIGELGALTLPHGWFPPVVPGTSHVTLGGAIAADVHGKNHHREGSFCDHLVSFELVTPGGMRLLVDREHEPDAFAATAGGMGLTGAIVEATVQLIPVETDRVRVDTERARDLDDVLERMRTGDAGYRYSVAWIDCLARGRSLGRSVLLRGDHAARAEVPEGEREQGTVFAPERVLSAPPWAPSGLLSTPAIRAFNEAYFRRAPRLERGRLEPLHPYFFPLDAVRGWNRLYGPRGLLQYQLVVPFGAEDALRAVLERLARERQPAFLAVLKSFGGGRGLLSFPMPGWTLAVDMPAGRPELAPLLDALDELVVAAGGRLYLAKDSRLRPEVLGDMYPELGRWRELRARLDPGGVLRSDLARRVGLLGEERPSSEGRRDGGGARSGRRRPGPRRRPRKATGADR